MNGFAGLAAVSLASGPSSVSVTLCRPRTATTLPELGAVVSRRMLALPVALRPYSGLLTPLLVVGNLQEFAHHGAITLLEDVQGQHEPREQHRVEREERKPDGRHDPKA